MGIKVGKIGRIISGDHPGWFVRIDDDSEDTGGYLVLIANAPEFGTATEGYDEWCEKFEDLQAHFEHHQWEVAWLENE